MRIIIDDDQNPGDKLTKLMERAAELALSHEGIDHEGCEVSLSFVTAEEMRALNAEYRGVDEATDVLSFPMYESTAKISKNPLTLLGDVVICMEVAEKQAGAWVKIAEKQAGMRAAQ